MTTRSATRTINSYRFTNKNRVAQNLVKRKSVIGAIQGFGKPEFSLQYLVVGGGGAGGSSGGGGGGGGGVVTGTMGFTSNPLYAGFSATASFYYQRSPGTNRCEMQVTAVGSGYLQPGAAINIPGVTGDYQVVIVDQRNGTAGGVGNYSVSAVLTAPTCPVSTVQPSVSPPAYALTPRNVTGTSGIAYNTPIGIGVGGGGGGRSDNTGNLGQGSSFGFINAYGGGGGGSAGLPAPANTDARGAGSATSVATGGGQGAFYAWRSPSPYGFVAGSVQGGYGGVPWRSGADVDVRNGGSGNKGSDQSFPGYPGPTQTTDYGAMPYNLRGYGGGGGGAAGQDTPTAPSDNARGGDGGSGYTWIDGISYGGGGGGSSYQPTNNPSNGGGSEAGMGCVYNGGDQMFDGGTAPSGAPLPPYGGKAGYGGVSGDDQSVTAAKNRGGGGGGRFNGASYFSYPSPAWTGNGGPLWPGLGGAALWPANYANPGAPTWRSRNSGSEGGSGGSGIVIIRYPAVFGNVSNSGSPDVSVTPTGFIQYKFTGSGSITFDYNL
jgi:hypothetical protein